METITKLDFLMRMLTYGFNIQLGWFRNTFYEFVRNYVSFFLNRLNIIDSF